MSPAAGLPWHIEETCFNAKQEAIGFLRGFEGLVSP